jgi:hypothetical protein
MSCKSWLMLAAGVLPAVLGAQMPSDPVTELARGWAPSALKVTCQTRGAKGEFLGADREYCGWPAGKGWSLGVVISRSYPGMSIATWELRPVAELFVDSLSRSLKGRGYKARLCVEDVGSDPQTRDVLWTSDSVDVLVMHSPEAEKGGVTVIATHPGAIPAMIAERCQSEF